MIRYFLVILVLLFVCGSYHVSGENEKISEFTTGFVIENGGIFNFGTYSANLEKKHPFILQNTGTDDLILEKIRSTCECSALEPGKKFLKPGEKTVLIGVIKPESVSGPYSKNIYIETNRPSAKLIKLTLQGNAIPLFTVQPSQFMYVGSLKTGEKKVFSFKVNLNDKNTVFVLPEIPKNSDYAVTMEHKETYYVVNVIITPKKASGFFSIELSIAVASPQKWNPLIIKLNGKAVE